MRKPSRRKSVCKPLVKVDRLWMQHAANLVFHKGRNLLASTAVDRNAGGPRINLGINGDVTEYVSKESLRLPNDSFEEPKKKLFFGKNARPVLNVVRVGAVSQHFGGSQASENLLIVSLRDLEVVGLAKMHRH